MSDINLHVVLVQAWIRKGNQYLMAQRSLKDDQAAGMWSIPGGKVDMDMGNGIIESTLKREILEEVGLTVLKFELKKIDRFIDYDKSTNKLVHDSFFHKFEVTDYTGELITKTLESENSWMNEEEIKSLSDKLAPSVVDHYNSSKDNGKSIFIEEREGHCR